MTRTTKTNPTLISLGTSPNDGTGTTLFQAGQFINNNFEDLYAAVNAIPDPTYTLPEATDTTLGGVKVGTGLSVSLDGTISTNVTSVSPATSNPLPDGTVAVGTSLLYARADHVHPLVTSFPSGIIVMWSGSIVSIPVGWVLCNGGNGTPDLRSKFIVGAGSAYAVGTNGGNADSIVISHSHTLSTNATFTGSALAAHTHTVTDPGHTHTIGPSTQGSGGSAGVQGAHWDGSNTGSSTTGITIDSKSAGTPSGTLGGRTETTGQSGVGANLPPYYALAYIMKT